MKTNLIKVNVEHNQQRVLTTQQIADSYGTDTQNISKNFTRNEDKYKEGIHFFKLEGIEKTEFLNHVQIHDGSKHAKTLYLWTEKGALLHAKSLNTDKAWEVYDMLIDTYFRYKELQPMCNEDIMIQQLQNIKTLRLKQEQLQKEQLQLKATQEQQEEKIEVIETKLDAYGEQNFCITAYANLHGYTGLTDDVAKQLGKQCSNICKASGIAIGQVAHGRWGRVNSYPKDILDIVFKRFHKEY
jgi:hypothetical protein